MDAGSTSRRSMWQHLWDKVPCRPGQTALPSRQNDVLVLAVSIAVVLVTGWLVRSRSVPGWEADLFDWLNDIPLPSGACGIVDVLQNAGGVWAPAVVGGVVLLFRRYWTAVALFVAMGWKQIIEYEVVKEIVGRQRPRFAQVDADVRCGAPCDADPAFPSGHAIVLFFMAGFIASLLPRRWAWAPYLIATLLITTRVMIGAHSPLDAVAGAAIGIGIVALCNIVFGGLARFTSTQARQTADRAN